MTITHTGQVAYQTPTCHFCGIASIITMTAEQASAMQERRTPVQTLFPDMSPDEREVLISGLHPTCWNEIFDHEDVEA